MPANDLKPLLDGLKKMQKKALDGAAAGIDAITGALTDELRNSAAHGDDTGATSASYNVRQVGRGKTGAQAFHAAQSAVESLNFGHSASSPVEVEGIGAIIDSGTDYQSKLETENAGLRATLTPFVAGLGSRLTQAAAAGSKRALS